MHSLAALPCVLVSLACVAPAQAPTPSEVGSSDARLERLEHALRAELEALREEHGFPGATAAVAFADGSSTSVAVGTLRPGGGGGGDVELAPSARMLAGSTGKLFVATCALLSVEAGQLELDARLAELPGWVEAAPWFTHLPNANELTLRHLLQHTSGLPDHVWDPRFHAALRADPGRTWEPTQLVALVADAPALFAVGEGWSYADTNFVVVGLVLEHVTGRGYYDLLREQLLRPLELADSVPQDRHVLPGLVPGHTGEPNPFGLPASLFVDGRHALNPELEYCGGGLMSTSEDLARFAAALCSGRIVTPESLAQMLDGVAASERVGPGFEYGLGVMLGSDAVGPHQGHTGWFPGYGSKVAWYPEQEFAIAVMVNTDDPAHIDGFPHEWGARLAAAVDGAR